MIPLGLIIGIILGVAAGGIFGVLTMSIDDDEQ